MVGKWFKRTGKRGEIFLASKFGIVHSSTGVSIDSSPEYCKQQCEESLAKLNTEYIDLCQLSFPRELTHGCLSPVGQDR